MVPENTLLEAETRKLIDEKLIACGWVIQDKNRLNLMQSPGVAVREMDTDTGIEALKKAKQLLKQYRQSILKAAVTGDLTKDLPRRQAGWRSSSFMNKSGKLVPTTGDKYFAYVLECEDGSLYKGFSKNLFQRINQHLDGKGAKWTKEHKPISIIYFDEFNTEKEAVEREKYYKSGSGREWLNKIREEHNKKYEPASQLLERILKERRQKWEEQQLEQFKAKGLPAPKKGIWWLYVLLCDDNSFYIGVTEDMLRRWKEHTSGQGAEHTKKHKPELIIHHEEFKSQKEAYNREKELKTGFGRKWLKREYEKGTLRQAGKIPKDDKWKEKYKEPEVPVIQDIPELTKEWIYVRLDTLTDIKGGMTVDSNRKKEGTMRLPYLRVANVQRGFLDLTQMKEIDMPLGKSDSFLLKDRDILFNEGGDRDKLGRGWVWRNEVDPCTYQNHVFRARAYSSELVSEFVSIFGNTYGQEYFIKRNYSAQPLTSSNFF